MNLLPERLKQARLDLGLTQREMAGEVMSTSFYSKVENGISDINTMDLLKILVAHHLDPTHFIQQVTEGLTQENTQEPKAVASAIYLAFYQHDLKRLRSIRSQLSTLKQTQQIIELSRLADLVAATITGSVDKLPESDKQQIRRSLFKNQNWTVDSLAIFADSMTIYQFDELAFLINAILKQAVKDRSTLLNRPHDLAIISTIMINFADSCFKEEEASLAERPLMWVAKLPAIPELIFYKLLGQYYQLKLDIRVDMIHASVDEIKRLLSSVGMGKVVASLP